jgi:myo-inositol 2-dehydrogenase / D-chiro-inositol 1-dehydrogenase
MNKELDLHLNRRNFLKTTSTAVASSALLGGLSLERSAHAANDDTLKIALIGCGGRGAGAASQALSTKGNVKLVAMADVFRDRLDLSFNELSGPHKDRMQVPEENKFIGFDAYKSAIALADVVLLTSSPGFRPIHFEEAVKQGKHVFMEKPVAIDAPGVRRVLAAAEEAKKKNLKVGVGLQRRHQNGYIEAMKRIQDGAIGDIILTRAYWNIGLPWQKNRQELNQQAGRTLTEMEYQMRNWYYFNWLSGDHICEQHIHNIDVICWLKGAMPVRAQGQGGHELRRGPDVGEIFDHHFIEFEYADGSRCFSQCRQMVNVANAVSEHAHGTKGTVDMDNSGRWVIRGQNPWKYTGPNNEPYQQEHDDLFAAIRNNTTYNEAPSAAMSNMLCVMGRMATYSGQVIEWDQALNSNIDLMPKKFSWDTQPLVLPGPGGLYAHAIPGVTAPV